MITKNKIFIGLSILFVSLFLISSISTAGEAAKKEGPPPSPTVSADKIQKIKDEQAAFMANFGAIQADESLGSARKTAGEFMHFFESTVKGTEADGGLSNKIKELMCVSCSVSQRCELCIIFHVYNAYAAGATPHEIMDASMVGVLFSGGPGMAENVLVAKACIDTFRNTKFDTP